MPPTTPQPATPTTATGSSTSRLRSEELMNIYNIATFRGHTVDCPEGPSVSTYIRQIDEARQLLGWNNEKTAIQAKLRLSDDLKASWVQKIDKQILPGRKVPHWNLWTPPRDEVGGVRWALEEEFGTTTSTKNSCLKVQRELNACVQIQGEGIKAYVRRIETAIENLVSVTMSQELTDADNFPEIYGFLVLYRLRTGMRQQSQSFLETFHREERTLEKIIKLVQDFESTEAGSRDIPQGSTRALAAAHEEDQAALAAASRTQRPGKFPTAPGATCGYCGIKNHTTAMCFRKQRDEEMGIYRDKCEGYPLKSMKEKKKDKKQRKIAAATSDGGQQQQQQSQQPLQQPQQPVQQPIPQQQVPQMQAQPPLPGHGTWPQDQYVAQLAAVNAAASAGYNPYHMVSNYPLYSSKNV